MSRLGIRTRLLLVVLAAIVVAVAGLVAGFNLVLERTLDHNSRDLVHARAIAQLNSLRIEHGRLRTGEAPDGRGSDTYAWVFRGRRALERPRAGATVERAARGLSGGPRRYRDVSPADTRLYAEPIVIGGKRVGTVVAAVSLEPYEETRRTALIASLVLGGLVLVLVGAAAWWLLGAALRPVVRMTRQAAAWSEQDLDHRFALGAPHDELTELAATLDGLLDRLAASLRREQRFSAELSHELRTPLAGLITESELALRRDRTPAEYRRALEVVHRNAQRLARTVDALVAAARYEMGTARGTTDAFGVAAAVADACSGLAADRELEVEVEPPPHPVRLGVDAELAERILQPVVENACRYGRRSVRLSVDRVDGAVVYAVADDGPGVPEGERERIFEPGARGRPVGENGAAGAGLGLALARRLARSADGEVEALSGDGGGRFAIRLPAG
jgi:signal transduction histidine kinase